MFGRSSSIRTEAIVLADGVLLDYVLVDGSEWGPNAKFRYAVQVQTGEGPPIEATAVGVASPLCSPQIGDVIIVDCDLKKRKATFDVTADARFDPVAVNKAMLDRAGALDQLEAELGTTGAYGTATVVVVDKGRQAFGSVEVTAQLRVRPESGPEFDASIIEWDLVDDDDLQPQLGQRRAVWFDPADPTRIAWRRGDGTAIKWRTPTICPDCGAPVDQSIAGRSDHPTCTFCHFPLPCQPA